MWRSASIAVLSAIAIYVAGYFIAGTHSEWSSGNGGKPLPCVTLAEPWLSFYRPLAWLEYKIRGTVILNPIPFLDGRPS